MVTKTTGGGADANIFFEKGILTGVLGTGMRDMHTVRESVNLDEYGPQYRSFTSFHLASCDWQRTFRNLTEEKP